MAEGASLEAMVIRDATVRIKQTVTMLEDDRTLVEIVKQIRASGVGAQELPDDLARGHHFSLTEKVRIRSWIEKQQRRHR